MNYNPALLELAAWRIQQDSEKEAETKVAFIPPQAMGQQGGATADPSQAQAAAGMQDPSAGGMSPTGGGAMPPPGGDALAAGPGGSAPVAGGNGMDASTMQQMVTQAVQQAMGGGMGGAGGGGLGKQPKPDIVMVATDVWQIKKLLTTLFNTMGIQLPAEIVDGPGRNSATGLPTTPNDPASTSNMSNTAPAQPGGAGGGQGMPGAAPQPGQPGQGPMSPISPMQGAMPPDQTKQSNVARMGQPTMDYTIDRAAALSALYRRLQTR